MGFQVGIRLLAHLGKEDEKSGFRKVKPDGGSIEDVGL